MSENQVNTPAQAEEEPVQDINILTLKTAHLLGGVLLLLMQKVELGLLERLMLGGLE